MKAAVYDRYGPPEVLHIEEVEAPEPRNGELLVRVRATTFNRSDSHRRAASPAVWRLALGLRRPRRRVLGMEFAGVVERIGVGVTDFAVGDRVFGMKWFGGHAELTTVPASRLVAHMPDNISFEDAAATPDGVMSALACLRGAGVAAGMEVLVYGASGSIGTACVQLATHMGARVTAVTRTQNVDLIRSLGAAAVIDYSRGDDFTKNRRAYDVVIDAMGRISWRRASPALKDGGRYVSTESLSSLLLAPMSRLARTRASILALRTTHADMEMLAGLLASGQYRAVIDRTYPLEEIVEASRYVDTRQKTGNVVLTVSSSDRSRG